MTIEPSTLVDLWMRLVDAWGGQATRYVVPPVAAVGRVGMGMPDGRAFNHIMVAMSLDLLGENRLHQTLTEAAPGLRAAAIHWAGEGTGIADNDFVSVVCLSVESTRPVWWDDLQQKLGAQLHFLGYDEWSALVRKHPALATEFFGETALKLAQAETRMADMQQDIRRLRNDNETYIKEYSEVASRRHRINAAEAFHRSVIDLRHGLAADVFGLHRRIKACRGSLPAQWPTAVFDDLWEITRRMDQRIRQMSSRRIPTRTREAIACQELAGRIETHARPYGVGIRRPATPPSGSVTVDTEGLLECVTELISNAQHWTSTQTQPDIRLTVQGCPLPGNAMALDVIVADNGPGVDDRFKADIFMPGTSLRDSSGHGLSMVALFCGDHGGETFENGRFGAGARFVLRLPVVVEKAS